MSVAHIKWQIKDAFSKRALSIQKKAQDAAFDATKDMNDMERREWLSLVTDALSKQDLSVPVVTLEALESAVAICFETDGNDDRLLTVIDLLSAPRFEFSEQRKMLVPVQALASAVGKASDALSVYRNRLKLVLQRTQRSEAYKRYSLNTVEALQGAPGTVKDAIVLGMLTQHSPGVYELEDLTGLTRIDLSDAKFHNGLFVDGCIMIVEGSFENNIFKARDIGLPPIESAHETREYFGTANWFGGDCKVAYCLDQQLRLLNCNNPGAKIIFVSDVWLDDPRVLKGLSTMFIGYAESPPVAFVFCGNFCSKIGVPETYERIANGFRHLSDLLQSLQEEHERLTQPRYIFIPGPDDPSLHSVLPRPPLPYSIFELTSKVQNVSFATNPCRIQYADQEIVVFRHDIIEKMCRNSIHLPKATTDIAEHFCRTLAAVGHLTPLPIHVLPIFWQMDNYLTLYPLPNLVIVADQFKQFTYSIKNCIFSNPGTFSRGGLEFQVYYPYSGAIDDSKIPPS